MCDDRFKQITRSRLNKCVNALFYALSISSYTIEVFNPVSSPLVMFRQFQ